MIIIYICIHIFIYIPILSRCLIVKSTLASSTRVYPMFRWPQECCLATCKLHDCSDGFVANSSYDSNTGVAVMKLAQSGVKSIQLRKHMLTYKIGMINNINISKSIYSLTSKHCKEMGMCQKLGINGPTSWTLLYLIAVSYPSQPARRQRRRVLR
jgi:hypothetical protein